MFDIIFSIFDESNEYFSLSNILTEGSLPFIPHVGDFITLSTRQKKHLKVQLDIVQTRWHEKFFIDSCDEVNINDFQRVEKIRYDTDSNKFRILLSCYKKETVEVFIKLYFPECVDFEIESSYKIRLGAIPKIDEFVYLNVPEKDYFKKAISVFKDYGFILPTISSDVFQVKKVAHFLIDKSIHIYLLPCERK